MKFRILQFVLLLFSAALLYGQKTEKKKCFVYVSLRDDNAIQVYELDTEKGELKHIEEYKLDGGPASMCFNPEKNILYVSHRASNGFSSHKIDTNSGRLTPFNSVRAIDNPVYISTDKKNNFLLSVYYAAGKSAIYKLKKDGSISDSLTQNNEGYVNPHSILTDATNRFVFIADKSGEKIYQYKFNDESGKIESNNPAEFVTVKNTGPRHFVFNNENTIAYFVNELGNSVSAYHLDKQNGTLELFQTVPTLPDDFTGSNTAADIHLTPNNNFLYATNRGCDSIAGFSVDKKTGLLQRIGIFPTEKTPREFDIDPAGKYLISAGEDSGNLALYLINKDGKLIPLQIVSAGKRPSWVLTLIF